MVVPLFLAVPRGCLRFVIVVFPDHTHLLYVLLFVTQGHPTWESIIDTVTRQTLL